MEIVFLGTSCMVPTKERNHQSIFLSYKEDGILLDCGEGTQRQLKITGIKPTKITKILLSHWHGDHVFGLPGLLQTINASEYEKKLEIYGPVGTKEHFEYMFKAFAFYPAFSYEIKEISGNVEIDMKDKLLIARELEHSVPCLGYSIVEKDRIRIRLNYINNLGIPAGPLLGKLQNNESILWKGKKISPDDATYIVNGKKISFVLDTVLCNNAAFLAKNADLLVSEAVYATLQENKAEEFKHMTAKQAAILASENNVKKLVLTHFSQRYKTTEEILKEARLVFENTYASYDFMRLKV